MNTRPWFISFTAVWEEAKGFNLLRNFLQKKQIIKRHIPVNHLVVKKFCWHFTVLPLLRLTRNSTETSAEDVMQSFLDSIWKGYFREDKTLPELVVEAYEIIAFDSGICMQFFSDDGSLGLIRDKLRRDVGKYIDKLVTENYNLISELEPLNRKNSGNVAYGSIARAVTRESNSIRWRVKIDPKIALQFRNIYLLISDEFLTNPYAHDTSRRIPITLGH